MNDWDFSLIGPCEFPDLYYDVARRETVVTEPLPLDNALGVEEDENGSHLKIQDVVLLPQIAWDSMAGPEPPDATGPPIASSAGQTAFPGHAVVQR